MALNDVSTQRQYTKYKRHVNDSGERINATDINKIQSDVTASQKETNVLKDTAFEERIYTIFENNLFVNAMFKDLYDNGMYIDNVQSKNVIRDANKGQVILDINQTEGKIISSKIVSAYGEQVAINDFFLITNEYIPTGASIKYYITTVSGEKYPITANALKTPLHLYENLKYGFTITAELKANAMNESPYINGYAILYWDAQVEYNYGLTNPDLQRFP